MQYLNGCTFGFMSPRGFTEREEWKRSLRLMKEETGCDTVVLPVAALQDHAYSTRVDFDTPEVMSFDDVRAVAREARALGLRFVLKAMVNCRDGYWRAYIRFFDQYVPTEPTWAEWFASYEAFVVSLAKVARETEANLFCVGCEMVGADHRAAEWRRLIARVRENYPGPVTYNCDKFQRITSPGGTRWTAFPLPAIIPSTGWTRILNALKPYRKNSTAPSSLWKAAAPAAGAANTPPTTGAWAGNRAWTRKRNGSPLTRTPCSAIPASGAPCCGTGAPSASIPLSGQ